MLLAVAVMYKRNWQLSLIKFAERLLNLMEKNACSQLEEYQLEKTYPAAL